MCVGLSYIRHEMPTDPNDPLANQNLKDRYYGVNDPVAEKMLKQVCMIVCKIHYNSKLVKIHKGI